jgi:hypothetical protein
MVTTMRLEEIRLFGVDVPVEELKSTNAPQDEASERFSRNHEAFLAKSAQAIEEETEKYGGNPLPWEPGGEKYFQVVD